MADFRAATAVRQAIGDAATGLIDAGPAAGVIKIYSGPIPSSVNNALSGNTLLAELTLSDPSFAATNAAGVATANVIAADASADATGAATFFRIEDSTGAVRFQGDVTDTAGAGDLKISNVNIQAGVEVQITSFTITVPEV